MLNFVRLRPNESPFGRFVAYLSGCLAIGACIMLALMMYITFIDVVMRYFFNAPIAGSVEIIYCLMGLLICMGFGLATYEEGHVRVDILTSILSPGLQAFCNLVANFLSTVAAGLVCWRLFVTAIDQTKDMNVTQVLHLPVWLVALVMAASSILLLVTLLLHTGRAASTIWKLMKSS